MNSRVGYLDALRGFGILSVVYSHLIVMGMRDSGYVSSVNPIIQLYFMPLFFFISGFFSEKLGRLGEFIDVLKLLISKGKSLLLPTAVMLTLSVFYFGQNFNSVLVDSYKGGYWFTYVLFCILSIYMSLSFLLRKFSNFLGGGNSTCICIIAALCIKTY